MSTPKYKIEKNVPFPQKNRYRGMFPFDALEVGDSFFVPAGDDGWRAVLASAAHYFNKTSGRQVKTRKEEGGARVWRVEDPVSQSPCEVILEPVRRSA